jgi:predicted O-linked N-acetylglucosamine transferase (SPINDLY family)
MLIRSLLRGLKRPSSPSGAAEGLAAWRAGDLAGAETALRRAIAAGDASPETLHGLGSVLIAARRVDEGREALRLAVESAPGNAGYRVSLGQACVAGGLVDEAVDAFTTALEIAPDLLEVEATLHKPLLDGCQWSRAADMVARLTERARTAPAEVWTRGLDPWVALSLPIAPALRLEAARQRARRVAARATAYARPRCRPPGAGTRLRVGYLSADFHDHATAHLATGLFEQHDRATMEVFAYSLGRDDGSAVRRRIVNAFDVFRDVQSADAAAVAQAIADDAIAILVDLKGYTAQAQPEILALRPAPVQVQYLGFPGSMQAGFIDYVLADRIVIPSGHEDAYREAVVRLPASYQANDDRCPIASEAPPRAACGLPEAGFVFCCFNQNYKIEPDMFAAWMRILAAVPGSVLWLFRSNEAAERRLSAAAGAAGVDPARLVFARLAPKAEHLARHRHADLFLDTHTYNAHTTASDALWAGVPVLTWPDEAFAGRVSASLLNAVGLPELVVPTLEAYVATAVALARDRDRLAALRRRLAANRHSEPLFQTERFARGVERAFAGMADRLRAGASPRGFDVA